LLIVINTFVSVSVLLHHIPASVGTVMTYDVAAWQSFINLRIVFATCAMIGML
jgi:hypothetical protein